MTAVLLGITGLLNRLAMRLTLYGCWYKAMNPDEPDELWKCLLSAVSTYIDFVGLHQITFGLFKVPLRKIAWFIYEYTSKFSFIFSSISIILSIYSST